MNLYLDIKKAVDQGITRSKASYAARVVIGVEKDGSPMYRYFKTKEAYEAYRKKHNKKEDEEEKDSDKESKKDTLKDKVDSEHKESVRKIKSKENETKDKFSRNTKKSIRIYVDE